MTHTEVEQQDIIDRYLLRRLPAAVEEEFVAHYLACRACVEELESSGEAIAALRETPVEELRFPPPHRPPWRFPLTAWGLAATLVAAFLLLVVARVFRQPPRTEIAAAPAPPALRIELPVIELRSYRSGGERAATLAPAAKAFVLRLDVRGLAPQPSYRLDLVTEAGEAAWSRDLAASPGGETIDVTVEGARLRPGLYWVRLSSLPAGGSPRLLREYSLQVGP